MQEATYGQWTIVILFFVVLFFISPKAKNMGEFFLASKDGRSPSFLMLTSSLVISWIFAKSITNAANLGFQSGIVGGIAYAAYYLSFLVAGLVIYQMRVKGNIKSIHSFLERKFGKSSLLVFSILIGIRLFNEVWSNTMVIGSYFGEAGTINYYFAILLFTSLTLAYTLKGGLSSSFFTDAIQMTLFGCLLFLILGQLLPAHVGEILPEIRGEGWDVVGGFNLLAVALLQVFSYPFHDPVLTDRAFIASPKVSLNSFLTATGVGGLCILLFSFVGVIARSKGLEGDPAVEISSTFGIGMMLMMNSIMITSAASTLDSAFASFSKLTVMDLGLKEKSNLSIGRWAMVLLAMLGTIPVFLGPEILSATTISGLMVMGLTPVFICWRTQVPKVSFHLSVGISLLLGILMALGLIPSFLIFFKGKYGDLLSISLISLILSFLFFFIPKWIFKSNQKLKILATFQEKF
ncbi:sodium:solute symporter family transporter [Xanthovirga aplysinae]|uniref:sodium:solute symporter family transporter n=1 Tax=Xanthovirga aplysinae TaxID=2529853 RepID=UPI0012BD7640|nr:sodium:solute symporter [Xanthovirga aplysinae]MTI32744.1 sodium:solute symporter [Xanthovirga aplysinae]